VADDLGWKDVGFNGATDIKTPDKVAALQQRLNELAKQSERPLFLVDQFKVVIKGMHGAPILPTDEDFAGIEEP
jgi:hypothetical protein